MNRKYKWMTSSLLVLSLVALPLTAGCQMSGKTNVSAMSPGTAGGSQGITTGGQGNVMIKPDQATLVLGLTTNDEKAAVAAEANAKLMTDMVAALEKLGVKKEEIETSGYNIYPQYDYQGSIPKMTGYQVSNMVQVTISDIDKVSEILDGAVAAGANQVQQISFSVKDSKKAYDQALELAVKDARQKAEILAKAAGLSGKLTVVSISENAYNAVPMYARLESAVAGAGDFKTPISPSQLEISASVNVTFSFE